MYLVASKIIKTKSSFYLQRQQCWSALTDLTRSRAMLTGFVCWSSVSVQVAYGGKLEILRRSKVSTELKAALVMGSSWFVIGATVIVLVSLHAMH